MAEPSRPTFVRRRVRGGSADHEWSIAVETPVEVALNGEPFTVMMATPADLEDLAVGLACTERLIDDPGAIRGAVVRDYSEGLSVDLDVDPAALKAPPQPRTLEGRIGCGLCGIDRLAALPAPKNGAHVRRAVADDAIARAFAALPALQPLNRQTHSVHAAAWCSLAGEIELVREDVGRHNALDKVIGARLRAGRGGEAGFVVVTSRLSFELVYKAAFTAAGVLAAISAPTSLALDWSETLRLPIACVNGGAIVRFGGDHDG